MKLFKLSDIKALSLQKWKSMELLGTERELRRKKRVTMEMKKEEETKHFWNKEDLYEPLSSYMKSINLPSPSCSPYFLNSCDKGIKTLSSHIYCLSTIIRVFSFYHIALFQAR